MWFVIIRIKAKGLEFGFFVSYLRSTKNHRKAQGGTMTNKNFGKP